MKVIFVNIKTKLKKFDIKLSRLASDMNISRPTLDNYINSYEKGVTLPNEKYQRIFNQLFENDTDSTIEFALKYDRAKKLMEEDKNENTNHIAERKYKTQEKIISALYNNELDVNLLDFINLFIENSDNDLVKSLYMYFNYTNGYLPIVIESIELKDQALFSQLAQLFSSYNDNNVQLIRAQFDKFVEKNRKMHEKYVKNNSIEDILNQIKKNSKNNPDVDYSYIKEMLIKIKGEQK